MTRDSSAVNRFYTVEHLQLKRPCDVYLREKSFEQLLSYHVSYLRFAVAHKTNFARDIGVRVQVRLDDVVTLLRVWAGLDCQEADPRPHKFCTSLQHMKAVYRYLLQQHENVKQLLIDDDLFFIPDGDCAAGNNSDADVIEGAFCRLSELCWHDQTGLFTRYKPSFTKPSGEAYTRKQVALFYPNMKEFFLETIGLNRSPNLNECVMLLCQICQETKLPDRTAVTDIYKIYAVLGEKCISQQQYSQSHGRQDSGQDVMWQEMDSSFVSSLRGFLQNEAVFPTTNNKFVTLADKPLLQDDKALADLFADKHPLDVNFLDNDVVDRLLQDSDLADHCDVEKGVALFLRALGVATLTSDLEVECVEEHTRPSPALHSYMHGLVPFVQKFMKSRKSFQQIYARLKKIKIAEDLKLMTYFQVGKLEVVYRLKYKPEINVTITEKIKVRLDAHQMFIHINSLDSYYDINKEVCKLFVATDNTEQGRDLFMFLNALKQFLKDGSPATEEEFSGLYGLQEIPDDDQVWSVPPPPMYASQPTHGETNPNLPSDLNWTAEDEAKIKPGSDSGATCWPPPKPRRDGHVDESSSGSGGVVKESLLEIWPRPPQDNDADICATVCEREQQDMGRETIPALSDAERSTVEKADHKSNYEPQAPVEAPCKEGNTMQQSTPTGDQTRQGQSSKLEMKRQQSSDENSVHDAVPAGAYVGEKLPDSSQSKTPQVSTLGGRTGQHGGSVSRTSNFANLLRPVEFLAGTTIEDIVFEDIGDVNKQISVTGATISTATEGSEEVGRWGEEWVYRYLQHIYCAEIQAEQVKVTWCNPDNESGRPYDIVFQIHHPDSKPELHYIEVKATKTEDKEMFEISQQQVLTAREKKQFYHVYRVYNAGGATEHVKLKILRNITQLMEGKVVQLCMFL